MEKSKLKRQSLSRRREALVIIHTSMASLDPPDPNFPGDQGSNNDMTPPRTPKLVLKDKDSSPLPPDTEDHVAAQTEGVFVTFVHQMFNHDRCEQEADDTPNVPELTQFPEHPFGPTAQVGRQLAMIGDDINERYAPQFNQMVTVLQITPSTAYEAFAGVARKLFHDGNINWGRIITLLCFGYRIAVTVFQRGIRGFFSKIVAYVCKFILTEKIAKWIAEQGGWVASLRYVPETIGWPTVGLIFGVAALAITTALYLTKR